MEVHHHPHVEKKKFKEYFLEFLMIFLAVTMGFFAENIREHFTDREKEKQYIVSMLGELEADTSQLKSVLNDSVRVAGIDSMVRYINTNGFESLDTRRLYYFKRKYLSNVKFMRYSNNTLSQLKNAGNMRLIRERNVIDSLNKLDNLVGNSEEQAAFVLSQFQNHTHFGNEIFNEWFYLDNGKKISTNNAELILNWSVAPPLLTREQNDLIKYSNMASNWGGAVGNYNRMLLINYNFSLQLISFLKEEYNIR